MENKSATCEFLLHISQNRSPNRVCRPSKVSHCSSVTRILHPIRLFIARGKLLRVLLRRIFFNRSRQIFPPIRGTSHSRSDCISTTTITCKSNIFKQIHKQKLSARVNKQNHCLCTIRKHLIRLISHSKQETLKLLPPLTPCLPPTHSQGHKTCN